jgi:hypothetical protein
MYAVRQNIVVNLVKSGRKIKKGQGSCVDAIDRIKKVIQDLSDSRFSRETSPEARLLGRKQLVLKEKGGEFFGD